MFHLIYILTSGKGNTRQGDAMKANRTNQTSEASQLRAQFGLQDHKIYEPDIRMLDDAINAIEKDFAISVLDKYIEMNYSKYRAYYDSYYDSYYDYKMTFQSIINTELMNYSKYRAYYDSYEEQNKKGTL